MMEQQHHHHHHHHHQQQQQAPPKPLKQDPSSKPKALIPISFSNGSGSALKKHRLIPHHNHDNSLYGECLKNHAASLGGHSLDGCGEFMPSPSFNPSVPTSLTCAACGCHRNFHRRLHHLPSPPHSPGRHHYLHHHYRDKAPDDSDDEDQPPAAANEEDEEEEDEDDDDDDLHGRGRSSSPPVHPNPPPPPSATPYNNSVPHMLMALSAGVPAPLPSGGGTSTAAPAPSMLPRKRFRTRFSAEQKEGMHQLSERLGWRLQKRDEAVVDQCCREIGIGKGVFKVWMHNNKHNFHKAQHAAPAPAPGTGGGGGGADTTGGVNGTGNSINIDADNHGNGNHALNGSSPPSSSS